MNIKFWGFYLAVLLFYPSVHASLITVQLNDSNADDGSLDSSTELFRSSQSLSGATFDLLITAVAANGVFNEGTSAELAITTLAGDSSNIDVSGEDASFSLLIDNFSSGSSGFVLGDLDFGFRTLELSAATAAADEGNFNMINGSSSAFAWADGNGGSDFTGHLGTDAQFDLQAMNAGNRVTSFSHLYVGGAWRYDNVDIEFNFTPIPEPTTLVGLLSLAIGGFLLSLRRKRVSAVAKR
ncbi:MAG: PEP-CTERM sorting domain-containing protein [Verrucomicrobiota bacterium]